MQIEERDKGKTVLKTIYGHFQYQIILFGLANISTTFQGYINKIVAEKLDIFVIVYFDNILNYTKNKEK